MGPMRDIGNSTSCIHGGRNHSPHFPHPRTFSPAHIFICPRSSYWETQNLTTAMVGARISKFAIGSLAVMADLNPQISGQGTVPILGYQLAVSWIRLIPLVASIAVVHLLLVVVMLWIARSVVVPDDSNGAFVTEAGGATRGE